MNLFLADMLGTTWWTILMFGGGFVLGVFMSSMIKNMLNR